MNNYIYIYIIINYHVVIMLVEQPPRMGAHKLSHRQIHY